MKVIAVILTATLMGVMAWMVMDARSEAKGMRNQFDLMRKQQQQQQPAPLAPAPHMVPGVDENDVIKGREQQILQEKMARTQPGAATPAAPLGRAPVLPPDQGVAGAPPAAGITPAGSASSPALAQALNAAASSQLPKTPRQRMVAGAPVLAKVTDIQTEFGFVVINAGQTRKLEKDMTFALRRAGFIIGRIKVMEISADGSVANIVDGSVPPGVALEIGDDVIQDLPPEI